MTNLKHLLLLAFVVISTYGCDLAKPVKCQHFVLTYDYVEDIILKYNVYGKGEIFVFPYFGQNGDKCCDFLSKGDSYKQYIALCEKHNDMSYDHTVSVISGGDFGGPAYAKCDFTHLAVTSDKDFDASHPKGQSLNDIVRFIAFSPNKFIQSGYKKKYDYTKDNSLSNIFRQIVSIGIVSNSKLYESPQPYHPIDKLVSELEEEDLILLGYEVCSPIFCLSFEKEPEMGNETHNITITLDTDDGRTFTKSIPVEF